MVEDKIYLPDIVGRGYKEFWNWKGRYLVCRGSRGSKKSTTAALKIICEMMRIPDSHTLVVRKYASLHRNSTFAQLIWAIHRLHVDHLWKINQTMMTITYKPTGQQIIFKGLDDVLGITSLTTATGALCFIWIEEAFQIVEDDFNKLDLSLRGELPPGAYAQIILTFNPWSSQSWLKSRFFDCGCPPDPLEGTAESSCSYVCCQDLTGDTKRPHSTLALRTDYRTNEWLTDDDKEVFGSMIERFPQRARVEAFGAWGVVGDLVYNNWTVEEFDHMELYRKMKGGSRVYTEHYGIDFGFSVDPTAFVALLADEPNRRIYVYDELYQHGMTNKEIAVALQKYNNVKIVADSAEPKTINELWNEGLYRIEAAKKGRDSIRAGIQKLQSYHIIVHPSCRNFERELMSYGWEQREDGIYSGRTVGPDHLMDAMRYACEDLRSERFSW